MKISFKTLITVAVVWSPLSLFADTLIFQQGAGGYSGTTDTHLRGGWPNAENGSSDIVYVDDPVVSHSELVQRGFQGLLRFEIIGNSNKQIASDSSIISATLTLTTGPSYRAAIGHGGRFHRMLMPWTESATWNLFGNGIQANGVEAVVTASATAGSASLYPKVQPGKISFDVTDDVSAWSAGELNYGWAILPWLNGTDGWGFLTSEYSYRSDRPQLTVEFTHGTHYVDVNNPTPSFPYTTWATAATSIQAAVDATSNGDLVAIKEGTYSLLTTITVNKDITLKSVDGPSVTFVDGGGSVRCFDLGNHDCQIIGLTIMNGYASHHGGGVYCASASPVVSNCVITGNSASRNGGGMHKGTANNCTISLNTAAGGGGGLNWSVANNCAISRNSANIGGGLSQGTALNCTVTANKANNTGGGMFGGMAYNSIIWHNKSASRNQDLGGRFTSVNCCSPDVSHGVSGNITNAPLLASVSHIVPGSSCFGAGNALFVAGTDIDGQLWRNPPSIGCDEFHGAGSVAGTPSVSMGGLIGVVENYPLDLFAEISGQVTDHIWDFGNGITETNNPFPMPVWSVPGKYDVVLTAYNDTHTGGIAFTRTIHVATLDVATLYVAAETGNDASDGSDWDHAKSSINNAVESHLYWGGRILVSNGVYNSVSGIVVDKALIVQSANGPEETIVNGTGAANGVFLGDRCRLRGVSVRDAIRGVRSFHSSVVENCWVYNNYGTGIFRGSAYDCIVSNNINAGGIGGGLDDVTAYNCLVVSNYARIGGGIDMSAGNGTVVGVNGAAYNCTVIGNTAEENGGGIYGGLAYNCLIEGNLARNSGGGISDALAMNCTVVGNAAGISGGGTYKSELFVPQPDMNSIVYGNSAPTYPEMNYTAMATNSCSPALISGVNGNINADPLFINPAAGDYRLLATSPCIDAGMNEVDLSTVDLAGNPRIIDGDLDDDSVIDMGAYEFQVIRVDIDVKPGSKINPINLKSKGRVPVAVLSTEAFDVDAIHIGSISFVGAAPAHRAFEDVDGDGDIDLILHFNTQELNLRNDSTFALLLGQTHEGMLLGGSDSIEIIPSKK